MNSTANKNAVTTTTGDSAYSYWIWCILALLTAVVYMSTIWDTALDTPQGDGIIQSLFVVMHFLDGDTFADKLNNTLWTYFQHRAVMTKVIVLFQYAILGHLNIHSLSLISNLALCLLVLLIARDITKKRLPAYGIAIASLMVLSFYSYTVATWGECALFYYVTLLLAFIAFFLLDLSRPAVLLAAIFSWLAAFTMANGLLTIVIGSLIVIYNQLSDKRYSPAQLTLWSGSVIGCLAVHLYTMNVFSTDLFGAKSVEESFSNLSGRAVDFLESMGAAPFFPNEYRSGKIALGCTILATMAALATSRQSYRSPAIWGLMLFCSGTIFLTSLFRYSAGGSDGYQIFTTTNMAAVFIIGTGHIRASSRFILPTLMLVTALLFNLNPLHRNIDNAMKIEEKRTGELEKLLVTGKNLSWIEVMLQEAMTRHVYNPLQDHQTLKIPVEVKQLADCPNDHSQMTGTLTSTTGPKALATKVLATAPAQHTGKNITLLFCGEKNYRVKLGYKNIKPGLENFVEIEVLLDKREFLPATYHVFLQNDNAITAMTSDLTIPTIEPYDAEGKDCKVVTRDLSFKKAFRPIIDHYCN